jgi:hypothetical protein
LSDKELDEGIFTVCGEFSWTKTFFGGGATAVRGGYNATTETVVMLKITMGEAYTPRLVGRWRRYVGFMRSIVVVGGMVSMMNMNDASITLVSDRTCRILKGRCR